MRFSESMRQFDESNILRPDRLKKRRETGDCILDDFMSWWVNPGSVENSYFSAFSLSNKLFYEAVKCYEYGLFEEAMIAIRDTIDTALFFAVNYKPNFNTGKFNTGLSPSGERNKDYSLKDNWDYIKKRAIELHILNEDELDKINKLRDIGNFSAHIASRQETQLSKYGNKLAEGKSWKEITSEFERGPFMSEEGSREKLEVASKYLTLIRKRYFDHFIEIQ